MRRTLMGLAIAAVIALAASSAPASDATDKEAAKRIAASLRDSGRMKDYSVGVKCKNGTVWLAGKVRTAEQMSTALQLVSDMDGVEQIVNNLQVDPAAEKAAKAKSPVRQTGASTPVASPKPVRKASAAAPSPVKQTGAHGRAGGYRMLPAAAQMADGGEMEGGPGGNGGPIPAYVPGTGGGVAPASYDHPHMPNYAWPSYAAYPNYAALTYPKQYSPTAFPFIGPFYPYPQVPLGWRKVSLEWDDGWWFLDFDDHNHY